MTNYKDKENDIYYCAYQILLKSLKSKESNEVLDITKKAFDAEDVVFYKMDNKDNYSPLIKESTIDSNLVEIGKILNKLKIVLDNEQYIQVETSINKNEMNIIFQPIFFNESHYILVITNPKRVEDLELNISIIKESFKVAIEEYELVKELNKKGNKDSLTNLDNRNPFYERLKQISTSEKKYTFILFDLLRLKNINDTYGHDIGDNYILKASEVLRKYFPKYKIKQDKTGMKKRIPTGSCVYRIGGDEFALITTKKKKKEIQMKLSLIIEEIKNLKVGKKRNVLTGINYGVATREQEESGEELYKIADRELREDKAKSYQMLKSLGIERRS